MVKIIGYSLRENKSGKQFVILELQGGVIPMQSRETGQFYLAIKKAKIATTFDEATAQSLVGMEIKGRIERVVCEPYEFTNPETGEVTSVSFRHEFFPDDIPASLSIAHVKEAA